MNQAKIQEALSVARSLLQDRASFDQNERTYKLTLSARVKDILKAPPSDDEFLRALRRAFRHPQNNLTNYRAHSAFLKWAEEHLPAARQLIVTLAESGTPPAERVQHFDEVVPEPALATPGNRLSVVAYLLMGFEPERLPMIRVTAFQAAQRVLDWDQQPPAGAPLHDLYSMHLAFAERFRDQLQAAAVPIRDMLDVQSLIWVLATSDRPEVRAWRGPAAPATPVSPTVQDDPLPALVEEFKRAVGYPRDSDQKHWAAREEFAQHLTPEAVRALDWQHFRRIFSSSHYSNPGPQPGLNRYISHALAAVDQLNARLREKIGSHLQVGHSYFTKPGLTETDVERTWKYDVLPFLEDQLFGQDLDLAEFALKNLRTAPPAQSTTSGDSSAAQDGSANTDAPGVQHAPAGAAQPS